MPAQKFLTQQGGVLTEVAAKQTSAGAGDAGRIPALDDAGKLDMTMMPAGVGEDVKLIVASENLAAGDLVNIWSNAGVSNVRKADATAVGKLDDGYVLQAVTAGSQARVYFDGTNNALTGLSSGTPYYLSDSTPGGVSLNPPTGAGKVVRQIGKAMSATELTYQPERPIVLA